MMMAVFLPHTCTLAVAPHVHRDALFVAAVCALFGLFNGWFLGRLAADVRAYLGLQAGSAPPAAPARPV
jgi:hypothetical protein